MARTSPSRLVVCVALFALTITVLAQSRASAVSIPSPERRIANCCV
ncbi:MAG: hypothetical protein QM811_30795 [Pirellulales bacterium]